MRRIDRYAFREILGPCLLGILLFLVVLLINTFFKLAELAIRDRLSMSIILRLLVYIIPSQLVLTIPMAVLLGVLIGMGRMTADSEIIALRSCGVSPARLLIPVGALGLAGFLTASLLYHFVVPATSTAYLKLYAESLRTAELGARVRPRVFYEQIPGIVLYADEVDPRDGTLQRVFLWQDDTEPGGQTPNLFLAREARVGADPATGGIQVQMRQGSQHRVANSDPGSYQRIDFQEYVLSPDPRTTGVLVRRELESAGVTRDPRAMSVPDLVAGLRALAQAERPSNPDLLRRRRNTYIVEVHKRFSLPLACLVFALVALPLGVANRRGGSASSFTLAIGVILVYYVLILWGENKALLGQLSPHLCLWIANVVFLLAGGTLFVRHLRSIDLGFPGAMSRLRPLWRSAAALVLRVVRLPRRGQEAEEAPVPAGPVPLNERRTPFPRLLDLYVARRYLSTFVFVLVGLYVVFVFVHYFSDLSKFVLRNDVPLSTVADYFRFATPGIFVTMLPIVAMVALLVSLGLLQRTNEITALRVCGVSLYRAVAPVLLVGGLLSGLSYFLQSGLVPTANKRAGTVEDQIKGRAPAHMREGRRWLMGEDRRIYHYLYFDDRAGRILSLEVYGLDAGFRLLTRSYVAEARWNGRAWLLLHGWVRKFEPDGAETEYRRFFREPATGLRETPVTFRQERKPPDEMSFEELRRYIATLRRSGYDSKGLEYDLYDKVAQPANVFVLVLLGIPFSLMLGKRGALYGVGLALLLSLVYFAVLAVFAALGHAELVEPAVAAFGPGVLFTVLGTLLLLNLRT